MSFFFSNNRKEAGQREKLFPDDTLKLATNLLAVMRDLWGLLYYTIAVINSLLYIRRSQLRILRSHFLWLNSFLVDLASVGNLTLPFMKTLFFGKEIDIIMQNDFRAWL